MPRPRRHEFIAGDDCGGEHLLARQGFSLTVILRKEQIQAGFHSRFLPRQPKIRQPAGISSPLQESIPLALRLRQPGRLPPATAVFHTLTGLCPEFFIAWCQIYECLLSRERQARKECSLPPGDISL